MGRRKGSGADAPGLSPADTANRKPADAQKTGKKEYSWINELRAGRSISVSRMSDM